MVSRAWLEAVEEVAAKYGLTVDELRERVAEAYGMPPFEVPERVRFEREDDGSMRTFIVSTLRYDTLSIVRPPFYSGMQV